MQTFNILQRGVPWLDCRNQQPTVSVVWREASLLLLRCTDLEKISSAVCEEERVVKYKPMHSKPLQ